MFLREKHRKILENAWSTLLDIFFPRFCLNCEKEGLYICSNCTIFLSESFFICPVCEKSSYLGERHKWCKKKEQLDGLVNLWDYEGIVKKGIHLTKYNSTICPLEELTDNFFLRLQENKERLSLFFSFLGDKSTIITFVPTYSKRKMKRGFDQGEEIANILSKKTGKETKKLLYREKQTKSQTELNRKERKENVKDSFNFNNEEDVPSRVVIVDDVWTSGATMRECAKVLKKSGVKNIWGFTLAKTP